LIDQALAVSAALAKDDLTNARAAASATAQALSAVDMTLLEGDAHRRWMEAHHALTPSLRALAAARDIAPLRAAFAALAPELARLARTFGPPHDQTLYEIRCPMAFDNRGAMWLQTEETVRNPYFGASMLGCGEVVSTIAPAKAPSAQGGPTHE
jgi:Cu(I)/Ag(I) efflux system membrane fusion protein